MRAQPSSTHPSVHTLCDLFRCVDSEQFPSELGRQLHELVPVDRLLVYVVRREGAPVMLHAEPPADAAADRAERIYFGGGYRYDPYYRAFLAGSAGGFCTDAEAEDVGTSRRWQRVQHVAFLSPVSTQACLVALLVRTPGSRAFSAAELQRLRGLEDAVVSALRLHWSSWAERRMAARGAGGRELHHQVDSAIDDFGRSALTPREGQVVRLLLRGRSTKAAAERLGIAVATAALHRKRAYGKLGVCSQAELFYLFLCSLSRAEPTRVVALSRDAIAPVSRAGRDQSGWPRAVSGAS
ncbi:MAG: helix-turn-helix transcriptional regulator [Deltaproteobacteria bacterium]|nr:helix-turn-helix transcriptional regulator [Deltaproteobacteria bacterium]